MKEMIRKNKFFPFLLFCCFLGIFDVYALWISRLPMETKVMGTIALVILCSFMSVISLEDAKTKEITRKVNLLFIGYSFTAYVVHLIWVNLQHFSLESHGREWFCFGVFTLILALIEKGKRIGLGDVLFLIAMHICLMILYGPVAVNAILLGMMFACIILVTQQVLRKKKEKEDTQPLAPCMFIGTMLSLSLCFYLLL